MDQPVNSTVPTPDTQAQTKGLSDGAIAGIGVACAIAGALLATLAFLFLSKRRANNRRSEKDGYSYASASEAALSQKKGTIATVSFPDDSAAAIVEHNLPQSLDDAGISSEFSKIEDKINGHIESFYDKAISANHQAIANATVQATETGTTLSAGKLAESLASPTARSAVLRMAVARIIVSRIGYDCDSATSFLPNAISSGLQSMPPIKPEDTVRMAFLAKWRTITAVLLHGKYGQSTMAEADPRNENVRKAVGLADTILSPYADPNTDQQARIRNLEEIMRRAARFGFTLFSQPSFWKFDWQSSGGEFVIFPALLQLAGEDGKLLSQARVFTEKKIAKI